jgi:hypothetical protein
MFFHVFLMLKFTDKCIDFIIVILYVRCQIGHQKPQIKGETTSSPKGRMTMQSNGRQQTIEIFPVYIFFNIYVLLKYISISIVWNKYLE